MRRVGRPVSGMAKQLIAIRLSPAAIEPAPKDGRQAREALPVADS